MELRGCRLSRASPLAAASFFDEKDFNSMMILYATFFSSIKSYFIGVHK